MDQGFPMDVVVNHKEVGLGVFFSPQSDGAVLYLHVYVKIQRTIPKRTILL